MKLISRQVNAAEAMQAGAADRRIALPTALLLWSMLAAGLLVAGVWASLIAFGPWGAEAMLSGMAGIALSLAMTAMGVVIMTPWRPRLAMDWMTMWLGSTVFRVLATPAAAFLLYSAASSALAAKPFALSVAVTYMTTLFAEAAVLTHHLRRCFPAP